MLKDHYVYFSQRIGIEHNLQFVNSALQIEREKEPNIENPTLEKQLELKENPHLEPMDINDPDPTGPRRSTRISACKARGLDYDKVETNIAFYLTEFNTHYIEDECEYYWFVVCIQD